MFPKPSGDTTATSGGGDGDNDNQDTDVVKELDESQHDETSHRERIEEVEQTFLEEQNEVAEVVNRMATRKRKRQSLQSSSPPSTTNRENSTTKQEILASTAADDFGSSPSGGKQPQQNTEYIGDDFDRIGQIFANRLRALKKINARKCENEILNLIFNYEIAEEEDRN